MDRELDIRLPGRRRQGLVVMYTVTEWDSQFNLPSDDRVCDVLTAWN